MLNGRIVLDDLDDLDAAVIITNICDFGSIKQITTENDFFALECAQVIINSEGVLIIGFDYRPQPHRNHESNYHHRKVKFRIPFNQNVG